MSHAQFHAFTDTWSWADAAETYHQFIDNCPNVAVVEMMEAFHSFLKNSPMMAYLAMMAPRLVELHRVLKETGSLYLHCDPTASHFLKLMLDGIFGPLFFKNEIIWKRTTAHSNVYSNYEDVTDSTFFYAKSDAYTWNQLYRRVDDLEAAFPNVDTNGRRWRSENMRNPGIRPNLHYAYTASNSITYQPHPNGWTVSVIRCYFLKRDRLQVPVDLYMSTIYHPDQLLRARFLTLVQAIEAYHRVSMPGKYMDEKTYDTGLRELLWQAIPATIDADFREALKNKLKYLHEFSLRKRIEALTHKYTTVIGKLLGSAADFASTTSELRNRLTHPEPSHGGAKLDYKLLWHLSEKIALLLETCSLDEFGFSENRIKEIVRSRSQRARHVHFGAF